MNKKLKFAVIIPVHKDPYMKGYARPEHLLSMIIDRIGSRSASTKCETPESQPVVLIHAPEDDSMPINMRASEIAGTSIYGPVIAVGPEQLDLMYGFSFDEAEQLRHYVDQMQTNHQQPAVDPMATAVDRLMRRFSGVM